MTDIRYIQSTERQVGEGHATLTDTLNRALRDVLTASGLDPDADFGGFSPAGSLGVFNVKQYGATGDGTTNDTTTIQAALTAATASGGIVYFPPGTYRADGLTLDTATDVILDAGEATIKARTNAVSTRILALEDCVRCEVRGGVWDGNSLARGGIHVSGACVDIVLRGVTVLNITQLATETDMACGIDVRPFGGATPPIGVQILDCIVDGVAPPITGIARGIYVGHSGGPGIHPRDILIRGGEIRNISGANGDGIQFNGDSTYETDAVIEGMAFRECEHRAIKAEAQRISVIGCDIRNDAVTFTSPPISLYASHQVCVGNRIYGPRSNHGIEIGDGVSVVDIICDGNIIELDAGTAVSAQDGISFQGDVRGFSISNNVIIKCRTGIAFTASTGNPSSGVVSGNVLRDFTGTGIRSDTTSPVLTTGVLYADNVFDTATGTVGILLKDGSLNAAVGNIAKALGGGASLISGMTTDAVCTRWANTGGTSDVVSNTITDPIRFTKGLSVGTIGNGGDLTLSNAYHTIRQSASAATRTLTLPAAASHTGRRYNIIKTDSTANLVILDGNASETIDGLTTYSLVAQYQWVTIESDGSNWFVVAASRRIEGWLALTGDTTVADDYDGYFLGDTTHTLTLQSAATRRRPLQLRSTASGNWTITRAGSDTIEGATTLTLTPGTYVRLMPNGTDWLAV